jgi:predicted 3-demethylubiquinone-9 3-methyltransferase (glyoxalase superfamily)
MAAVQKISPFLWFDNNMEEAVKFYVSVFPDSKVTTMNPMTSSFELCGHEFMALNGGPMFKFTEAVSFFVKCKDQAEVDNYWNKLLAGGGAESQCGWLKDRFGLSWQIIPDALGRYLQDKDPAKAQRVMQAMLKMKKIIVADLEKAAAAT